MSHHQRRFGHGGQAEAQVSVQLDLSVNLNPYGMPAAVRHALSCNPDRFMAYPDPFCRKLTTAIGEHEHVDPRYILCGNGASDLIHRVCQVLRPRRALVLEPTFSEYERSLRVFGSEIASHCLHEKESFDVTLDVANALTDELDLLFLCHPNNPTGRLIPSDTLRQIIERAKERNIMTIVDECFLDFTYGVSAKEFWHDKMIIIKAFTKIYSLAGLRLGYLLTPDESLIVKLREAGANWSVSSIAQEAGLAALTDSSWLLKTRELIATERTYLVDQLKRLGFHVYPGDANFILLRSSLPLYRLLLGQGILIRDCSNFNGLDKRYVRVAVRSRAENEKLLAALTSIVSAMPSRS